MPVSNKKSSSIHGAKAPQENDIKSAPASVKSEQPKVAPRKAPAASRKKPAKTVAVKKSARGNEYPNILVHGMCGWGRDEIFGQHFRYWGGKDGDFQEYLKSKGYETFTASMGPISSNWDRACELYTFLVGGIVDYGAVHSARYGHARFGRCYPGVLPEVSDINKVHLIGHSQGGPTARLLIHLLENGDPDECAFIPGPREAPTSDLFKGGKRWVHSMTSIAGVHNGTPLADDMHDLMDALLHNAAAMAGISEKEEFFNFNLDQWGLERKQGETIGAYFKRIIASHIWRSNDCCVYDLSIEAAHLQNIVVQTSKNVYYTSYAADGTFSDPLGKRLPTPNMNPALKLGAAMIGANERDLPGGAKVWRPNDGAVPVPSAQYPFGHNHEFVQPDKSFTPKKGVWYVHPTLTNKDHISVIVPWLDVTIGELNDLYERIALYNSRL